MIISLENLVFEALVENLMVSKYCIDFRKDVVKWKREGCYGYSAAILLFSIADTIGSYIHHGNTETHFKILNNSSYYNLGASNEDLKEIYKNYRNLLTHNSALPIGRFLAIGSSSDNVIMHGSNGEVILNLVPFWNKTYYCVEKFLKETNLKNNKKALEILNIPAPISSD